MSGSFRLIQIHARSYHTIFINRFNLKSFFAKGSFSGVNGLGPIAFGRSDNTNELVQRWLVIDAGEDALAIEIQRQSLLFHRFMTGLLTEYIEPSIATKRVL